MREFAFVILNDFDQITDRFNLDYVDSLSGLGFSLELSKIESDLEDYITKVVQKKQSISLTVYHKQRYKAGDYLRLWLSQHIDDCLCLEYNNGEAIRYIEGKVTSITQTDVTKYGLLEHKVTFQPVTPFFEKIENDVKIQNSSVGKQYPYSYPYCYGVSKIVNNEIVNDYIKDIPLIVTIYGELEDPTILLIDEDDNTYNEIRFENVELADANECIVINSAQKKIRHIVYDDDGNETTNEDYFYKLNGAYDSYLRAAANTTSKISINLGSSSGYLVASRRQYKL